MRLRLVLGFVAFACAACSDNNGFFDTGPLPDVGNGDTGIDSGGHDSGTFDAADSPAADHTTDAVDTSDGPPSDAHDVVDVSVVIDASDASTTDASDATSDSPAIDVTDAPSDVPTADVVDAPDGSSASPWRHSIMIDGTNDFTTASEQFTTTSTSYAAYITWDATNLYIGYAGPDVAAADAHKWLFAYLDTDPGAGTGAGMGQTYNTETPSFPAGFGAEFYFRWKTSNDFQTLEQYDTVSSSWSTVTGVTVRTGLSGTYVEFAIPLTSIGSPSSVGVITLMMNETAFAEAAYAGLYAGSFTDGYHPTVMIANYLRADFASSLPPNDPSNRRP